MLPSAGIAGDGVFGRPGKGDELPGIFCRSVKNLQEGFVMIEKLENVTAIAKANVYFDGKVVSHTVYLANGDRKTLGLFLPGEYEIASARCSFQVQRSGRSLRRASPSIYRRTASSASAAMSRCSMSVPT